MSNYEIEDFIETHSGAKFFPHLPGPFYIGDIAIALSRQNRFNGHTRWPYSVAEHACIMYDKGKEMGLDAKTLRTILHHDDAEAYMGDLPRPIKNMIPQFKEMELRLDEAIAEEFDLIYPFPAIVKEMDSRILVDERAQVMSKSGHAWGTDSLEPLGVTIECWDPDTAMEEFMIRYRETLEPERKPETLLIALAQSVVEDLSEDMFQLGNWDGEIENGNLSLEDYECIRDNLRVRATVEKKNDN